VSAEARMFKKILIANRGESGREADASAQPHCLAREAHAGDFDPIGARNV
jgi:hypothetical protein